MSCCSPSASKLNVLNKPTLVSVPDDGPQGPTHVAFTDESNKTLVFDDNTHANFSMSQHNGMNSTKIVRVMGYTLHSFVQAEHTCWQTTVPLT